MDDVFLLWQQKHQEIKLHNNKMVPKTAVTANSIAYVKVLEMVISHAFIEAPIHDLLTGTITNCWSRVPDSLCEGGK